ncbi:unnamed protein product [Rhizophagus irregularis]|nr:unnamed protein product [Rhizophagus irregularis]
MTRNAGTNSRTGLWVEDHLNIHFCQIGTKMVKKFKKKVLGKGSAAIGQTGIQYFEGSAAHWTYGIQHFEGSAPYWTYGIQHFEGSAAYWTYGLWNSTFRRFSTLALVRIIHRLSDI